jgi:hypothetical protein
VRLAERGRSRPSPPPPIEAHELMLTRVLFYGVVSSQTKKVVEFFVEVS